MITFSLKIQIFWNFFEWTTSKVIVYFVNRNIPCQPEVTCHYIDVSSAFLTLLTGGLSVILYLSAALIPAQPRLSVFLIVLFWYNLSLPYTCVLKNIRPWVSLSKFVKIIELDVITSSWFDQFIKFWGTVCIYWAIKF